MIADYNTTQWFSFGVNLGNALDKMLVGVEGIV